MVYNRKGPTSKAIIAALLAWLLLIAAVLPSAAQSVERPTSWSDGSRGNRVPANYDLILPDDRVHEIFITFTPEAWAAEEADMTEIYGERGMAGTGFGRRGCLSADWLPNGGPRLSQPLCCASGAGLVTGVHASPDDLHFRV